MTTNAMLDASNVGVAKGREGGYSAVAPDGTNPSLFEDVSKTIADVLKTVSTAASLGYISGDGVTKSLETETTDINDWRGDLIKSDMTSLSESVQVTFLESRDSVLKTVYGDANVTTDGAVTTIRHNQRFTGPHLFVFDCVISDTKVKRTIIPRGVIMERDEQAENNSDVLGYTPTIKCLASPAYEGDTMREFIYDASAAQASKEQSEVTPVA